MIRIFLPEPLPIEVHSLFYFRYHSDKPWRGVFDTDLPPNFFECEALYVDRPEEAQAIVLPNNFKQLGQESSAYIKKWCDEAERLRMPLFLFSYGDLHDQLRFDDRAFVFRLSTYRSLKGPHDIIVPTTAQVFREEDIVMRTKRTIPVVSFCGFAGFQKRMQWIRYVLKNIIWNIKSIREPLLIARKQGIYWRRKAIRVLQGSPLVQTHFIIRRSFSGALRTIELSPEQARKEFIDSIVKSDFILAPKGDGNYSNRFLEALSLGRIPVLIDTDTVLPLEETLDYSKVMVRVPMKDVQNIPYYIREFYDVLDNEEWAVRQRLARELFEKYLRQDVFFRNFFTSLHEHE